jgi:hypothetical protein
MLQAVSMEKERLKRDLTDNEDSLNLLKSSLSKLTDDCKEKQEGLGEFIILSQSKRKVEKDLIDKKDSQPQPSLLNTAKKTGGFR